MTDSKKMIPLSELTLLDRFLFDIDMRYGILRQNCRELNEIKR